MVFLHFNNHGVVQSDSSVVLPKLHVYRKSGRSFSPDLYVMKKAATFPRPLQRLWVDGGESSPDLDRQVPVDGEGRHDEFGRGEFVSLLLLKNQNNGGTEEHQAVWEDQHTEA